MKGSRKRPMPLTPRSSMNVESLLEGLSEGAESAIAATNAGRTERTPKTRTMDPAGDSSSYGYGVSTASDPSLASVVASLAPELAAQEVAAPEVAAPEVAAPEVAAPEPAAPEVAAPEVAAPEVAPPAGIHEQGQLVQLQGAARRKRRVSTLAMTYTNRQNQIVTSRFTYLRKHKMQLTFNFRGAGEANSSDDSDASIEGDYKDDGFESNNDTERDGRGDGDGAGADLLA